MMTRCFHCGYDSKDATKDANPRELQDMDTMNPEYVKELALNKLEQIQHQIDELKEQHKQQHEQLLSELNEVIKFIPEFWFIVFKSNFFLKYCFVEDDDDINKNMFSYLVSLTVVDDEEDFGGYAIDFVFKENPYFEDTTITKTVKVGNSAANSCGSSIKWKCTVNKSFLKWLIETSPEEEEDDRLKKIQAADEIRAVLKLSPL